MSEKSRAEPAENVENRLKALRIGKGLSQGLLAQMAGVTRQAIYAIEAGQYLPTTAVALRLAGALGCRVEDLFSLVSSGETLEGELVESLSDSSEGGPVRVKVARVGTRVLVRPVASLGEVLNFTVAADGLVMSGGTARRGVPGPGAKVSVRLLRDRRAVEEEIVVAGCDPAIYLAGEYLRRRQGRAMVVGWSLGSAAAVEALKRGEVHMAGLHVVDAKTGESNLPYLRRHLTRGDYVVVTFASWEQGLMVGRGNPKAIRDVGDVARRDVTLVNREAGSGARLLLDQRLAASGVKPDGVKGYRTVAVSHLEVARLIAEGRADVGMGVRAAARLLGLDFVPLQEERYDLVMPKSYLTLHRGLSDFLDTIVGRSFRSEIEALGGYDTSETGKVHALRAK